MEIKFISSSFYRFTSAETDKKIGEYIAEIYEKYGENNILHQDFIPYNGISDVIVTHTIRIDDKTPRIQD